MDRITTVLLDLDETILHDHHATDLALMATVNEAQRRCGVNPADLIAVVRHVAETRWAEGPFPDWCSAIGTDALEGLRADFYGDDVHWQTMRTFGPTFRHQTWLQSLARFGIHDDALASDLDAHFKARRDETNLFLDGAREALDALAARFTLGMITNGIPDVQRIKIDRAGLAPWFRHITVSGEIGVGKPDPAIFRQTLAAIGAEPAEAIMVGDNPVADIRGAQEAGIRGVWLSHGRAWAGDDVPWLTVPSLAELPDALRQRGN